MPAMPQKVPYLNFQLRDDLERYLVETREILNRIEWYFDGDPLKVDELHIDQNVITEQVKERLRGPEDDKRRFEAEFSQSPLEITQQAKLYELSNNLSDRIQTTWSNAVGKNGLRLAIIGAPGSGKSFTTRHTVIQKIDAALDLSRRRVCRLEDIQFPIWVTATELASQKRGSKKIDQPAAALEAIVRRSMDTFKLSEKFFRLLRHKLDLVFDQASGDSHYSDKKHIFLVVDSLDELPEDQEVHFTNISRHLHKPSLQLIVTCRTLQWNERSSWLGFTPKEKVEIAPLTKSQQRKFSVQFFRARQDLRSTMQGLLDGNPALSHAFTTPLLLTFGCFLHGDRERGEHSLNESTTYVQIYELVIFRIFDGSWREKSKKPYWAKNYRIEANRWIGQNSRIETEQHLGLLAKICWELFQKNPEANLFTQDDWTEACQKAKTVGEDEDIKIYDFLTALEKLGFVVEAGYKQTDPQWSFAHRTFLEFLAARALANRDDWLEIARQHFWFAPEWLECLTFLAGLLDVERVTELIETVRSQKDDIFGSMTYLEAKFTGASKLSGRNIELICDKLHWQITSQENVKGGVVELHRTHNSYLSGPARSSLVLNHFCKEYIFATYCQPIINSLSNYDNVDVQMVAANSLSGLGYGFPKIIAALCKSLEPEHDYTGLVRNHTTLVLGELGIDSQEVIAGLISVLQDDSVSNSWQVNAVHALGRLGYENPDVTTALINGLLSVNDSVRKHCVETLVKVTTNSREVAGALIKSLQNDNEVSSVRCSAAEGLGELGTDSFEVISALLDTFQSATDEYVRNSTALALVRLGNASTEVRGTLINSSNLWLIGRLIKSLDSQGADSSEGIRELLKHLKNYKNISEQNISIHIISGLGIDSFEVISALLDIFQSDADEYVRTSTALALVRLGYTSLELVPVLLKGLQYGGFPEDLASLSEALGKIFVKNKKGFSNLRSWRVIKAIASQLDRARVGYFVVPGFNGPLFEIWQTYRSHEKEPVLTWEMLEMN